MRDEIDHEWYEMCPPFSTKPPGFAVTAPFTQWEMETHYPNRDLCEQARTGAAGIATDAHSDMAAVLQRCRCFSSNDPRLDQKSVREIKQDYLNQAYREGLLKRPPK